MRGKDRFALTGFWKDVVTLHPAYPGSWDVTEREQHWERLGSYKRKAVIGGALSLPCNEGGLRTKLLSLWG